MTIHIDRDDIVEIIRGELANHITQPRRWYSLRDAAEVKGVSYNRVKNTPTLQPRGGVGDAILHGKRVWRRETVDVWCEVTDDKLAGYLKAVRALEGINNGV